MGIWTGMSLRTIEFAEARSTSILNNAVIFQRILQQIARHTLDCPFFDKLTFICSGTIDWSINA
ncbi:MAG: hypothetical protein CG439_1873 [Methylococcaceae bacterium NSP1-2]|nr:MAG: hypothetical protein CG439_1873 [Methylococcaceae bacterium NSP1-2]